MNIREKLPAKYPYELDTDAEQGFAAAVHNNQINLAMYYMIEIIANLQDDIEELRAETKSTPKSTTKKASAKKAATKKAATTVETEEASE